MLAYFKFNKNDTELYTTSLFDHKYNLQYSKFNFNIVYGSFIVPNSSSKFYSD